MKIASRNLRIRWWVVALLLTATFDHAGANQLLIAAVKEQDTATAKRLIEQHVDVNSPQPDGATALHWAVHRDDLKTAQLLIEAGADPNAKMQTPPKRYGFTGTRPVKNSTPMYLAAFAGEAEMMRLLAEHGADVNARADNHLTPLMVAAGVFRSVRELRVDKEDLLEAIKVAVELGADVVEQLLEYLDGLPKD